MGESRSGLALSLLLLLPLVSPFPERRTARASGAPGKMSFNLPRGEDDALHTASLFAAMRGGGRQVVREMLSAAMLSDHFELNVHTTHPSQLHRFALAREQPGGQISATAKNTARYHAGAGLRSLQRKAGQEPHEIPERSREFLRGRGLVDSAGAPTPAAHTLLRTAQALLATACRRASPSSLELADEEQVGRARLSPPVPLRSLTPRFTLGPCCPAATPSSAVAINPPRCPARSC